MQRENKSRLFWKNPRFLVIALVTAILLTVAVGTMAWIRYIRSLQTVTLVHVSDYYLVGPDGSNSAALNLDSIDVSNPGSKFYAFGVKSNQESYRFQLAYTTNIPFTYKIHRAIMASASTNSYTSLHQEAGYTFYYDTAALSGTFLNKEENLRTANDSRHNITFGSSDVKTQKYAEPVYWQTLVDVARLADIDYYVLEVTWSDPLPNNKETDLIYLTVGAPAGGSQ